MNDRFKFRAWDKKHKKIEYSGTGRFQYFIFYNENEMNIADAYMGSGDPNDWDEKFILMQCTGLKDRNGKLIFESDVVKYTEEYFIVKFGQIDEGNDYQGIGYYLEAIGKLYWRESLIHHEEFEVVGNEFGNPDLLKP